MPAVRDNSVDQAKPMITSDSDRTDSSATSQTHLHPARRAGQYIGEGEADDDADQGDQAASTSEKPRTLPKKADRKRP